MNYSNGLIKDTEFFTTAELAEKLKMNVQVITRKVQSGEIYAYKIGKDWRIPEFSVYQWLQSKSNENSPKKRKKAPIATAVTGEVDRLPTGKSNRRYLLEYILAQFEANREYSEEEVNRIIGRHHDDYGSLRQEFVAAQMMEKIGGNYRRRPDYQLSD